MGVYRDWETVGHGLVDPKRWGNSVLKCAALVGGKTLAGILITHRPHRKGIRLIFLNREADIGGGVKAFSS